ncbi:MAG: bactofilin family protein [Gammaproteobacteria bacterium]
MFGKTNRKKQDIQTLVGTHTRISGDIEFHGGLHLDGTVVGNICAEDDADAVLSVSQEGVIEGTVKAPQVVLNGTVKGDVIATDRVELGPTARVVGNVVYNLIEMAIGAEVNGKLVHQTEGRPDFVGASGVDKKQSIAVDEQSRPLKRTEPG